MRSLGLPPNFADETDGLRKIDRGVLFEMRLRIFMVVVVVCVCKPVCRMHGQARGKVLVPMGT
jgi:hypothetical protein